MSRSMFLAIGVMLFAMACGATETADEPPTVVDPTTTTTAVDNAVSSGMGPGISIAEALESTVSGPLLVNGFIITETDGTVYLAELLAESLAGGATLTVVGLDLASFPGLTTAQGITWSDQPVQLLGEVDDGVLTASTLSSG